MSNANLEPKTLSFENIRTILLHVSTAVLNDEDRRTRLAGKIGEFLDLVPTATRVHHAFTGINLIQVIPFESEKITPLYGIKQITVKFGHQTETTSGKGAAPLELAALFLNNCSLISQFFDNADVIPDLRIKSKITWNMDNTLTPGTAQCQLLHPLADLPN